MKNVSYIDTDSCIINDGINEVTINISKDKFMERAIDIINIIVDQVEIHDDPKNKYDLEVKIASRCIEALMAEVEKWGEREVDFVYLWTLSNIIKDISKENGFKDVYKASADYQEFLINCLKMGVKFRYV